MPGRVTTFLRNPGSNIAHIKNKSRSISPDTSDGEDVASHHYAVKKPEFADAMLKKRLSLPFGKKDPHCPAVAVDWSLESPPILFHGNVEDSTGALLSGQMILDIREDTVELEGFTASLRIRTSHKRPFQNNCNDCIHQFTELQSWRFIVQPMVLPRGKHQFPFTTLLEGHLPASMITSLMSITYEFKAEATIARHSLNVPSTASNVTKFERTIPVKRTLPQPDHPHHSVRLFPPTNIKTGAYYSPVIHAHTDNKVSLRLDGLVSVNEKAATLDIWKLKKVTWKLEETVKTVAPACGKHSPTAQEVGEGDQAKKGIQRNETHFLADKNIHEGWKSTYTSTDGTVELEFDYGLHHRRGKSEPKYAPDNKALDGTQVTHSLLLELVVSKEFAPIGKPNQSSQTGTGRVLRMNFPVILTENPGMGISWDEEAPPVYQNVPPSPPGYPTIESPIDYDDLEFLDACRINGESPSRRPSAWV